MEIVEFAGKFAVRFGCNMVLPGSSSVFDFCEAGYHAYNRNWTDAACSLVSGGIELATLGIMGSAARTAKDAGKAASINVAKSLSKDAGKKIGEETAKRIAKGEGKKILVEGAKLSVKMAKKKIGQETSVQIAKGGFKKILVETAKVSSKTASKQIGKETAKQVAQGIGNKVIIEGAKASYKEARKKIGKELGKEIGKKMLDETAKKAAYDLTATSLPIAGAIGAVKGLVESGGEGVMLNLVGGGTTQIIEEFFREVPNMTFKSDFAKASTKAASKVYSSTRYHVPVRVCATIKTTVTCAIRIIGQSKDK